MKAFANVTDDDRLHERLATGGFRFTPQRQHVYTVLLHQQDHPTADEVFMRTKQSMPEISLATVYNCLDALVKCGLVRQVNLDRAATRFCPNMHEHCHFSCESCGRVYDINLEQGNPCPNLAMPAGFRATQYEMAIRGFCPDCSASGERG